MAATGADGSLVHGRSGIMGVKSFRASISQTGWEDYKTEAPRALTDSGC